jgi:hypothetical protein
MGPSGEAQTTPSRRLPTIDLEATELPSNAQADPAGGGRAQTPEMASAAVPPEPASESNTIRPRYPWALLGAGGVGAGVATLVITAFWLAGAPGSIGPERTSALTDKVAALDREIRELAARPQPTIGPALPQTRFESRLAALETDLSRLGVLDERQAALAGRISALEKRPDILAAREIDRDAGSPGQKPGSEQVASVAAAAALEHGRVDARLVALDDDVTMLRKQLSELARNGADRAVRLALVAMEIRLAVDRGAPFAAEFAAVKHLIYDQTVLAPLEAAAAAGVPTAGMLAQGLAKLETTMLKAATAPEPQVGVLAQLGASAERLVRIRPVGELPGDDPASVIARAEMKVTRGDVAAALAELEKLPEPVRAPAGAWMKTAQARIASIDAARQLMTGALEQLAKTTQ